MAIPESQLETWSHQGAMAQSSATYQAVRGALLADDSGYADKDFKVFLQGSYGNDTNIYSESDVDVVIRLDSTYRFDASKLTPNDTQAFEIARSPATYSLSEFKTGVTAQLRRVFGSAAVTIGTKAITIAADGARRKSDVIVCQEYRNYKSFNAYKTTDYVSGIVFPTPSGDIINYPTQHCENLTKTHQATGNMLKPMVRILKNMRSRMVKDGLLADGLAPSYYIEGLFYNVPKDQYISTSFGDTWCKCINWLRKTDQTKLVCANWQYYLLGYSNVQWTAENCTKFLDGLVTLWNNW